MRPFTLVTSDDDLLLQRAVERVLADAPDGADVQRHDVDEEGLPDVRTSSLFGGEAVHVLQFRSTPTGGTAKELTEMAGDVDGDPVVVAVRHGERMPKTLERLGQAAGGGPAFVQAPTPPGWADERWTRLVGDEFRRLGRHADTGAIEAVLTHAGHDPSVVATQVASVVAVAPSDLATIDADAVEAAVGGLGRQSGFAVADAVAARRPSDALRLLRGSLDAGDEPVMLAGALNYRLRQLLVLRGGGSGRDAGLGRRPVSGGRLRALQREARQGFGPGELAWCVDRLARLDAELKGSDLPADLLIELAVIELATRRDDLDGLRPTHLNRPFTAPADA